MANVLAELKRRNIYRVGAFYAVVAWVLLQLIANVAPILELPPWVARAFLLLLVIGFPLAILLAWTREPEGDPTQRAMTGRLDWALMGALVVVIALVSYQQLASVSGIATTTQKPGVEAARVAAASPVGAISIAVLPFANLSDDASQEFFSDGMTEEIITALARIPDLRVVARGSASQFKGERRDLRAVGQALGATHLIEGSVRRAGTQLRITAQLVKADDGVNVWVNSYDRQLTDVFGIQEDIATAIAGALRMPLGLAPSERLVASRTIDAESYQQFLRAKPLVRLRARGVPEAIKILEPLVARNPDYAPAWAQLAAAYGLTPNYSRNGSVDELRRVVDTFLPKAEAAGRRAIQLDPSLADGYLALGRVQAERGKFLLAEDLYSKALALDANNPDTLSQYGVLLANVGRLKEAQAMMQQLRALEPFVPGFNVNFAEILWVNGQNDAAIAMLRELPLGNVNRAADLAMIYASMGRYSEAVDHLQEVPGEPFFPAATSLLRTAPAETASPRNLPRLGRLWFTYLHVGAPSRALETYEGFAEAGFFAVGADTAWLWHPAYTAVRKTERYKALLRKSGYVEYWGAKGWPEFCHPTTGDDFACT